MTLTYEPIKDRDDREVSVHATSASGNIGIHSWCKMIGTPEQERPSRSIFLDLENAKRLRDELDAEIAWMEGRDV